MSRTRIAVVRIVLLLLAFGPELVQAQCGITVSSFPYNEGFEAAPAWTAGGNASDWTWGTPNKPVIDGPGGGNRCWTVGGLVGSARVVARRSMGDRWGRFLLGPVDYLRHQHWVKKIFAISENAPYKYPYTAGLLSLVPGVGHWYAGQAIKGALLFAVGAVMAARIGSRHRNALPSLKDRTV